MPTGPVSAGMALAFQAWQLTAMFAATAVMGWIEGRSVWSYGLAARKWPALFGAGWFAGLVCLSTLVGVLHAKGYLAFDGFALHGWSIFHYGMLWTLDFCIVGLAEEMLSRGYLLATLSRVIGFWPAAVLSSVYFGVGHLTNHGESAAGIFQVVAAGLAWCLLLRVSGSLWLGIGFHAAWDWAQSAFYGTPNSGILAQGHLLATHPVGDAIMSGGSVGPEGSLFAAPIFVAGVLVLVFAALKSSKPIEGLAATAA